jgi:thiosulfate/3-mercaptopyruvate sulfurtransferase
MKHYFPAILFTVGVLTAQQPDGAGVNPPWTSAEVIQTAALAKMVDARQTPYLIHVGFPQFYKSKHIPGSIYAGPGRSDDGLAELKKAVAGAPKDAQILLYCGCCPWDHCPNLKPAYKLLRGLGYSNIKVVEIPTSFPKDWVEKGYPVEGNTASHGN